MSLRRLAAGVVRNVLFAIPFAAALAGQGGANCPGPSPACPCETFASSTQPIRPTPECYNAPQVGNLAFTLRLPSCPQTCPGPAPAPTSGRFGFLILGAVRVQPTPAYSLQAYHVNSCCGVAGNYGLVDMRGNAPYATHFYMGAPPYTLFPMPIPNDATLAGFVVYAQTMCVDGGPGLETCADLSGLLKVTVQP